MWLLCSNHSNTHPTPPHPPLSLAGIFITICHMMCNALSGQISRLGFLNPSLSECVPKISGQTRLTSCGLCSVLNLNSCSSSIESMIQKEFVSKQFFKFGNDEAKEKEDSPSFTLVYCGKSLPASPPPPQASSPSVS